MAEVINNIKVGEKIKKLLKEHQMTQDDLANKLSISKSAVSQNLRGKSSFDIQNLIRIAEIFNTTIDALLNINQTESNQVFSEYQKVVDKGLEAFEGVSAKDLTIKTPDLYGKVLMDYVIEKDALDIFKYLHEHQIEMVDKFYHRSKTVYLNIIIYGLKNNIENMNRYIEKYRQIQGSFLIEDQTMEKEIWQLLDKYKHKDILIEVTTIKKSFKHMFGIKRKVEPPRALSKPELVTLIAKYKLDNILDIWLDHGAALEDLTFSFEIMLMHQYEAGMIAYIDHFIDQPLSWIKRVALEVQRIYLMVIEQGSLKLIHKFAEKKLYTDLTRITNKMIKNKQLTNASELIINYPDALDFKNIALTALNLKYKTFVDSFIHKLTQTDLNYLFASINETEHEILLYILERGAKVDEKYYNIKTFKKVNTILKQLIDKGDAS